MNLGKRHRQASARGRALFASMSVIALLALACFPVFAHAECVSSSCVQYTESIPNAEGGNPSTPHKQPPVAKAADNGGASAPAGKADNPPSNDETNESAENGSSSKEGGVPAGNGNGNGGGGTGQSNPGGSAKPGSGAQVHHGGQNAATPASQSSSSSSPLVPILIAIAVLAAISVAVVMVRQRRQRRGPATAASPKAS